MLEGINVPVAEIFDPTLDQAGVRLLVKRDDLIHPDVSGNKWRKLKYNLQEAQWQQLTTLLTFGGAYSNHIAATAAAGKMYGFQTIGIIRGEEHRPLNPTLAFAVAQGMQLYYVDRSSYREKDTPAFIAALHQKWGDFYLIPEGGANHLGVKGCEEIVGNTDFDTVCCACGTGTTLAGIILSLRDKQQAVGFSALKGGAFLYDEIAQKIADSHHQPELAGLPSNWSLELDFHFGGYAKITPELRQFVQEFYVKHQLPLDFVYTGKLFYGLFERIRAQHWGRGTTILAIHTGGLQGNAGVLSEKGKVL